MFRAWIAAALPVALVLGAAPAQAAPAPVHVTSVGRGPTVTHGAAIRADGSTRITLFAGLPRDSQRLARRARAVSSPGSKAFRAHDTLRDIGREYGAPTSAVSALMSVAKELGITVRVDPTRLFARLTATVSTWEEILGVEVSYTPAPKGSAASERGPFPYATYYFVDPQTNNLVAIPSSLASVVRELIPAATVYDVAQDIPGPAPLPVAARAILPIDDTVPDPMPVNEGSPLGPACDVPAVAARQLYTPRQTRDVYGTTEVLAKGARGSTARVTIVSLGGGFATADLRSYAECFRVAAPKVVVTTGTGVPAEIVSFSAETHLDLQTAMGVLVDAQRIDLVQAVNDELNLGMLDGFSRALNRDGKATASPDTVSLSYGGCELQVAAEVQDGADGLPTVPLLEDVFAMAGLVGTSLFIASGDTGSSLCQAAGDYGEARATVSYPGSSPWVTVVGGTRLRLGAGNARVDEVAWNDVRFGLPGAGTGGYSAFFARPWYQPGVFPRDRRAVPDVAVLAAVYPGWALAYDGTILSIGGTSGSSPFTAANVALLAARERARGRSPLGFANPWLYSRGPQAFYDVTSGDNQVPVTVPGEFVNVPGCCQAVRGFDTVSGLGAPRFERLLAALGG